MSGAMQDQVATLLARNDLSFICHDRQVTPIFRVPTPNFSQTRRGMLYASSRETSPVDARRPCQHRARDVLMRNLCQEFRALRDLHKVCKLSSFRFTQTSPTFPTTTLEVVSVRGHDRQK